MQALELWQYGVIALGAAFVGFGKGGLPGVGNLTVVLLALALPAKTSVGVLLPILISADIMAVVIYRRHAQWRLHLPPVAVDAGRDSDRLLYF